MTDLALGRTTHLPRKNLMTMNLLQSFIPAFCMCCLATPAIAGTSFIRQLDDYGKKISTSSEAGVFKYVGSQQTMSAPLVSYVVKVRTTDSSFHAQTDARTNRNAYLANTGLRTVWEAKFCTQELRDMMREHKVNIVNGDLTDGAGKTQFIATCMRN